MNRFWFRAKQFCFGHLLIRISILFRISCLGFRIFLPLPHLLSIIIRLRRNLGLGLSHFGNSDLLALSLSKGFGLVSAERSEDGFRI
jgi:hypothetical protein